MRMRRGTEICTDVTAQRLVFLSRVWLLQGESLLRMLVSLTLAFPNYFVQMVV
jgi:hypothetical protein